VFNLNLLTRVKNVSDTCQKVLRHVSEDAEKGFSERHQHDICTSFMPSSHFSVGRGCLQQAQFSDGEEDGVAQHEGDDAHGEPYLQHVVLLDQAGRVGDGVRGRGDGQTHG